MSTITEIAVVVLTESSFHLVLLSVTEVTVVSLKKAIAVTKNIAVTGLPSLFKSIPRTLAVLSTAAVSTSRAIGKIIKATVSSTVSIIKHFFFYKILQVAVSSTSIINKSFGKIIQVVVSNTASLGRLIEKLLKVTSTAILLLFPAIIEKFGAVAKFTFIVGPKKLMIMVIKDRDILVDKAEKTLIFVKNRVIMLYRKL